jgi:hypothetical protein
VGGYTEIASGDQTADRIRELIRSLGLRPMLGNGWKVVVVNEADRMSDACEYLWLDALESLPRDTVILFTTNHAEKMSTRFRTRCEVIEFTADADTIRDAVQARIDAVWTAETGRDDAPRLDRLKGVEANGEISIRAALQALNPLIRQARKRPAIDWSLILHAWQTAGQIVIEGRNGDEYVFRYHGDTDARSALQARVDDVWRTEGGRGQSPDVSDLLTGTLGRFSLASKLAGPSLAWPEFVPSAQVSNPADVLETLPRSKPRKPRRKTA